MPRSMTAYASVLTPAVHGIVWVIELHSVNRKTLDLHLHLDRELLFLDLELRKMLSDQVFRGNITLRIHCKIAEQAALEFNQLKTLKTKWQKAATSLGYGKEVITLPFLIEQLGKFPIDEEMDKISQEVLKKGMKEALKSFLMMKEKEGKVLCADIAKRLKMLTTHLLKIEKLASEAPEKYRQKLTKKLAQLVEDISKDERVLKEIALFAEKIDVTEEIVRLRSHIDQTKKLLVSKEPSIGKTLDFLLQEMLREVNTISAKSSDLEITKLTILLKAELEKIREQVQNIE